MATTLQIRRGTASEAAAFTGSPGELFVDATNFRLYVHDGVTQGGHPVDTTLDGQALSALINSKQDRLVSGTSIKTINGTTLLGVGDIVIINDVTSINGQTGDVMLNVLPSSPAELLSGLYAQPLSLVATGISDGGTLKATFTSSVMAQADIDDETLHAFGKSIHNNPNYQLFFGNQPPLTLQWNLPAFELNRTFVCAELNLASEVDNGDGTFTLTPTVVRASIPTDVPGQWMQMDATQLLAAIEGNDVMGPDGTGGQEVKIIGTPEYAAMVQNELVNMQCFSKYTTIMHLVAASLGDFIQ
jgi:hypothetical protein